MSIYALRDPRDGRCRYVGRSNKPSARFKSHVDRPHSRGLRGWIEELRSAGVTPELAVLDGGTEREWIVRLKPDLNVRVGDPFDSPASTAFSRSGDSSMLLQVRMTAEQKRLFTRAAEAQGLDLSGLTRQLLIREVDRLRAEGKKL